MNEEKLKKSIINYFNYNMQERGNSDYHIENIRLFETDGKKYALADVKYVWRLNAWDKNVKHNDMIFVLSEFCGIGEWQSPLFCN